MENLINIAAKENGNTGVIYLVESPIDLHTISQDSGHYGEYVAVVDYKRFE